jgi:molybdopterin-guanine dinucleotide biosynthesis protein A
MAETAVILLAGGEAVRFPEKLEHRIDGKAMLEQAYDRVRGAGWPVYVAGKGSFSRELDAHLQAPLFIDRKRGRGPLHAFLGVCANVRERRLFAVGGDQPHIDLDVMHRLAAAWEHGDEAVVPTHDGRIEPLGALYDRAAALSAGFELRNAGSPGMRDLIGRLAARFLPCDARCFRSVNRPEDLLQR